MYVEHIYIWYMHVYGCAHVSHVRIKRALVFVCFIQLQPGLALVQEKHAWKIWIQIDKKIRHDYIRRDNCKMLHWSKTRGTPQHNPNTHEPPSCANKRTTTAASSRKKQYQSVVPLLYVRVSYCPCRRCILRRVWMIRNGYMRKHVVHVPMSRNVTTVWMLTWIQHLSL